MEGLGRYVDGLRWLARPAGAVQRGVRAQQPLTSQQRVRWLPQLSLI